MQLRKRQSIKLCHLNDDYTCTELWLLTVGCYKVKLLPINRYDCKCRRTQYNIQISSLVLS